MTTSRAFLFTQAAAFLLILLFVYTASDKLLHLTRFEHTLKSMDFFGGNVAAAALVIPLGELLLALLLLVPGARSWGFGGSAVLLAGFTLFVAYMLARGSKLPCSCGGVVSALSWKGHLYFNLAFTALAGAAWRLTNRHQEFIAINRGSRKPVETRRQN